MKTKKNKNVALEDKRITFLLIGLLLSFGIVLESFEWRYGSLNIKPISGVESESLYEPIMEVRIERPQPKQRAISAPKPKLRKDWVVVKKDDKVEVLKPKPVIEKKVDSDNHSLFDLNNDDFPDITDEGDDIDELGSVSTLEFYAVEEKPTFIGGEKALMKYLASNIQYPEIAKKRGIDGTVYVKFIINTDGSIGDVKVVKGKEKHLDAEAKRVIEFMPKWIPGKQRNRPVRVQYTIPIRYTLRN